MDYLVTLEDGRKCLMHHGVQGMHWGEWNEETRRKYLGSPKGDKLREKAANKRLQAEKARTNIAVLNEAARVHANEITQGYAKANLHRIKQQSKERKAKGVQRKADAIRREGDDRKADKLERKSQRISQKAQLEADRAKRESDKAHAISNKVERHNIAVRKQDAEAAKLNAEASKLEAKANKADAKQDKRVEKAAAELREQVQRMKPFHDEYSKLQNEYAKAKSKNDLAKQESLSKEIARLEKDSPIFDEEVNGRFEAARYVATSGTKTASRVLGGIYVKNPDEFERQVSAVIANALAEADAIAKKGQATVDLEVEKALGTKRGYRYL